jgi:hypothetical protein
MKGSRLEALASLLTSAVLMLLTTEAPAANATFAVPRAELVTRIKTIGVMPSEVDEAVPNPDDIATRLEQDIEERLRRAGFTVVPASEMRAIRARGLATLGGLYDPMTGLLNREKLEALREFSTQEYRLHHAVDSTLQLGIVRRRARFSVGWSEWDGVRERVTSKSGLADVMSQGMETGIQISGPVPALSLAVSLVDAHGETVYTGMGGLLVLAYPAATDSLVDYNLSADSQDGGLSDPAITGRALTIAVDPLATGAVSDKPLQFKLAPTPKDSPARPVVVTALLQEHKRLVLASLEIPPPALEQSERVQSRYREMLAAGFAALGFELVGGNDFDVLWAAERSSAGGFYDIATGHPDLAKLNSSLARVLATLHQRYDAAGAIIPSIVARRAACTYGYAHWDGVDESVSGGGSLLFNSSIFNPSIGYAGLLDANSLRLRLLDIDGKVLYQSFGGVQLTRHLDRGRLVPVTASSLFADAARDTGAVGAALHALTPPATQHH